MKRSSARETIWARSVLLVCLASAIGLWPNGAGAQEQKARAKDAAVGGGESASQANGADSAPAGETEKGKKLYLSDGCFECHGTVGQGSTSTGGVRIGPPSISFEGMVEYLHHPSGQMPPYTSKVVSDQDLADIYAYLKSQPKPQPAKNIPLLNP